VDLADAVTEWSEGRSQLLAACFEPLTLRDSILVRLADHRLISILTRRRSAGGCAVRTWRPVDRYDPVTVATASTVRPDICDVGLHQGRRSAVGSRRLGLLDDAFVDYELALPKQQPGWKVRQSKVVRSRRYVDDAGSVSRLLIMAEPYSRFVLFPNCGFPSSLLRLFTAGYWFRKSERVFIERND